MATPERYPSSMRALHWVSALLVLSQLAIGAAMVGEDGTVLDGLFGWHTTVGVLILALALARLGNRLRAQAPPLPATMPARERVAARGVHAALYGLLIAVPVLGYLAAGADPDGAGVRLFGIELPAPLGDAPAAGEALAELHGALAWTLAGVVLVHFGAVVRHAFFDRAEHDVLRRML